MLSFIHADIALLYHLKFHQAPSSAESDKCWTGIRFIMDELCKQALGVGLDLITNNNVTQTLLRIVHTL